MFCLILSNIIYLVVKNKTKSLGVVGHDLENGYLMLLLLHFLFVICCFLVI